MWDKSYTETNTVWSLMSRIQLTNSKRKSYLWVPEGVGWYGGLRKLGESQKVQTSSYKHVLGCNVYYGDFN